MVMHDSECPYWDQVSLNNTVLKLKLDLALNVGLPLCHLCIQHLPILIYIHYVQFLYE